MPKRKTKSAEEQPAAKAAVIEASKTPNKDAFFAEIKSVSERVGSAEGNAWLRNPGDDSDSEIDSDEDEEVDVEKDRPMEYFRRARLLMMPPARSKEIDAAGKWLSAICGGDDDGSDLEEEMEEMDAMLETMDIPAAEKAEMRKQMMESMRGSGGLMMMNTQTGNIIIHEMGSIINAVASTKNLKTKFDKLVALTTTLYNMDAWIHDNEEWGKDGLLDKQITLLAKTWKNLLSKSNQELGIDAEFTRPGVEYLMRKFSELCDVSEAVSVSFKWK